MAMNFPDSPTPGQVFTFANRTWVWNGSTWINNASFPDEFTDLMLMGG